MRTENLQRKCNTADIAEQEKRYLLVITFHAIPSFYHI